MNIPLLRRTLALAIIGALLLPVFPIAAQTADVPAEPPVEETTEPAPESTSDVAEITEAEEATDDTTEVEEAAEIVEEVIETLADSSEEAASSTEPITETAADIASRTDSLPEEPETPTIVSGTAIALANILNLINSNFINSKGVVLFSSLFEAVGEAIDFRDYESDSCAPTCAQGESVRVELSSDARIVNDIVVRASSGGNIIDEAGNAIIETGDAYAGLNLINIANTTIVDSSYLLVTVNAFQDVNNDIVFPSLFDFFAALAGGARSPSVLDIDNVAEVTNNVTVDADSGGNEATDSATSTIATGDSHAATNVFNQINSTLAGDRSVSILFRVHGNWAGEVFGAPEGLSWIEDPAGGIYLFDSHEPSARPSGDTEIVSASSALIENNVSVMALTGENHVSNANTALISTGSAYAGANIVNIANGNVVGRNWILAVINIFGDFNGNIAFGRPDLWVGEQVDVPSKITDGSILEYRHAVINNGDAVASEVTLTDTYDSNHLIILDSPYAYTQEGNELTFALGTLEPGSGTEITYRAQVAASPGTDITNTVSVVEHETDDNLADNTDTATVRTYEPSSGGSSTNNDDEEEDLGGSFSHRKLSVTRLTPESVVSSRNTPVQQEIVIKNPSKKKSVSVILRDVVRDPSGIIVQEEPWNLGPLLPGEEVTVTYDIEFGETAPEGLYTLTTVVDGPEDDDPAYQNGTILFALPQMLSSASTDDDGSSSGDIEVEITSFIEPEVAHAEDGQSAAVYAAGIAPKLLIAVTAVLGSVLLFIMYWRMRQETQEEQI